MGHEASGMIVSVGSLVIEVSVSDRVAIEPDTPCRPCTLCKGGTYNLCRQIRFAEALSKYFLAQDDLVYKLPDGINLQEAVLIDPLSTSVLTVRLAFVKPGETIAVTGSVQSVYCVRLLRSSLGHIESSSLTFWKRSWVLRCRT